MTKDEMIEQLLQQVNSLTETLAVQTELIAQLNQTIHELKEQINKNSKNSSKPPSSDGFKKPSPKSLRKPSGKKGGGQEGHPGTHLAVISEPDDVIGHMPSACEGCRHYQMCKGTACVAERRHVIDAVVTVNVMEHQLLEIPICMLHGDSRKGAFPLNNNQQIYVVCPSIESEDMLSTKDALKKYTQMLSRVKVEELNGKMSPNKTEEVLKSFKDGITKVLIATTVVEVGVDVPNASVIIIENAERFGLAGLHQLRGRVGRGDAQSYCILISKDKENERLKALCQETDGFKIAQMDMEILRKPGQLVGIKQSGYNLYIDEMLRYPGSYNIILAAAKTLPKETLEFHNRKIQDVTSKMRKKCISFV